MQHISKYIEVIKKRLIGKKLEVVCKCKETETMADQNKRIQQEVLASGASNYPPGYKEE